MKIMKIWRIAFATLATFSLAYCSSDDKDMVNDAYKTLSGITLMDWPLTDCSTSTRPVRDLVAYKLLDVPYKWEVDWMSGTTYIIQPDFSGIIASRDVSRNEKAAAESLGVELETAPLAIDALVFIVNPKNPVKNLTTDQVRKIYTGEITNWKEVGGVDHAITPYIRDADSGSQEKMETLVMNGLNMIDGTYMPEIIGSQMASPYLQLEHDEYGIGYTPFFYCTAMVRDLLNVKMLSIDGVNPSKESLRGDKYPFVSSIYAAVRKSESHESIAYKLYQFLFTKNGSDMIDESGYIAF